MDATFITAYSYFAPGTSTIFDKMAKDHFAKGFRVMFTDGMSSSIEVSSVTGASESDVASLSG
jgi:hypothetical protein